MKKQRTRSMRRRVAVGVFAAMLLLWLVTMGVLTVLAARNIVLQVERSIEEQMSLIVKNCALTLEQGRTKGQRQVQLAQQLTSAAPVLRDLDGGIVMGIYSSDGEELFRSPVSYGYGYTEGYGQGDLYYLDMSHFTDEEHIALTDWIITEKMEEPEERVAQVLFYGPHVLEVTGVVDDFSIQVQSLRVLRGEENKETIIELPEERVQGTLTTVTLLHGDIKSCLLPAMSSSGRVGRVNQKAVLNSIHRAAAWTEPMLQIKTDYTDRSVRDTWGYGGASAEYDWYEDENFGLMVSWYYNALPAAMVRQSVAYVATFGIALLITWILSAILADSLSKPVEQLAREAAAGKRCTADGPVKELNMLAGAFNEAQGKLKQDLKREQELTRAVAHELKTPLAVLRSHAEALQEDIVPEKREQYLNILMEESDRMDALVKELLDLARIESGRTELQKETVSLDDCARRALERIRGAAEEKNCAIVLHLEPITVSGDRKQLERAMENYASNALRHCRKGGTITVALTQEEETTCLMVDNDGETVPEEELPRLFETFYRGDAARSRDSGGTGLGLAIVRGIAALHGGNCWAENRPGGVRFFLQLPRKESGTES